jgi:hypothetical protein
MASLEEQLAKAIQKSDLAKMKKLIDEGAALDVVADLPSSSDLLPLSRAAEIGIKPTRLLVERGADVNDVSDRYGALTAALYAEKYDVVRFLLKHTDEPDPLALQACKDAKAVKLLLDAGCDPEPFIKSALRVLRSRNDGDAELQQLAMLLRAVLPKASKKRRGEIESALDSFEAWMNPEAKPKRGGKAPSLSATAKEAGQAAGASAEIEGRPTAKLLADMADEAWEHDGKPEFEMTFLDELDEAAAIYTKAFIAAAKRKR